MNSVEILIKEYETLRSEILTSMSNRISILSFGLATIGAIFTASMAVFITSNNVILPSMILSLAIPLTSNFVLIMWLGEYQRMQRAGQFLVGLEKRINDEASKQLLSWETSHRHMKYPYNTTVMLLLAISIISYIIGIVNLPIPGIVVGTLVTVGIGIHVAICINTIHKISELLKGFSYTEAPNTGST
jgi:hypothetical protein